MCINTHRPPSHQPTPTLALVPPPSSHPFFPESIRDSILSSCHNPRKVQSVCPGTEFRRNGLPADPLLPWPFLVAIRVIADGQGQAGTTKC